MDLVQLLAAGAAIVLVDLVLSGDNALVIGAAAARLPAAHQRQALLWGGVGALVFRVALAAVATELLRVPLLEAVGGVIVLGISVRLAKPDGEDEAARSLRGRGSHLLGAIVTIMVADITMSLDNVLAIGALAAGNVPLLAAGLTLSVALLFVASALVALLVRRLWWLLDLAVVVLGWTAAGMIAQDPTVSGWLQQANQTLGLGPIPSDPLGPAQTAVYAACLAVAVAADLAFHLVPLTRSRPAAKPAPQAGDAVARTPVASRPDAADER
jgi:YjbE family integral membrane protein